jgi:hypothetical protein
MGISLSHSRAFVRQQLLQGEEVNLAARSQYRGVNVPQAVQWPKARGKASGFSYPVNRTPDFDSLLTTAAREHKRRIIVARVISKHFPGCLVHRYGLVFAALGLADMDETSFKVNIFPSEFEQFAPPHAGKQGHPHKIGGLNIPILIYGRQEV